jgi:hypothetical protein
VRNLEEHENEAAKRQVAAHAGNGTELAVLVVVRVHLVDTHDDRHDRQQEDEGERGKPGWCFRSHVATEAKRIATDAETAAFGR